MKRRIKLVVFLLLGAILNVAMAWGCAYYLKPYAGARQSGISRSGTGKWQIQVYSRVGAECFSSIWSQEFGKPKLLTGIDPAALFPKWAEPHQEPTEWPDSEPSLSVWQGQANGFPCLAMCSYRKGMPPFGVVSAGRPIGSGIININFSTQKVLPLGIIWLGFAIDTTFYAAILWMLFAFPFTIRRWHRRRRIKRGLCPACAYPVGTNPHCTECGKPVEATAR